LKLVDIIRFVAALRTFSEAMSLGLIEASRWQWTSSGSGGFSEAMSFGLIDASSDHPTSLIPGSIAE